MDKNAKTVKQEIGLRVCMAVVKRMLPDLRCFSPLKSEGVCHLEFKPLFRVVANSSVDVVLQWNSSIADKHKVDKAAVIAAFEDSVGGGWVQWS